MISIRGLHKFFNKGRQNEIHVINDVSLDLPQSGMVAIFGPSGCGKTTLLNVIGGLDGFAAGSVSIDGKSIKEDTDALRNRFVGYIFQNYNLLKSESCFENVAAALRLCGMTDAAKIRERVMAALANVGMEAYAERTPDTLSGGQQQRIAIARAIVKNPRIILADEPTGNLDEANTVMVMDLLKAISRDHLVLLVTHEAHLVDYYCDTVIELRDGCIVSKRENASANGYAARDKNDIYLGELPKKTPADACAEIEYYGDAPQEPVRLKIVNNGGKLYLKVESGHVHLLDEGSEIRLREGVFEEKEHQNTLSASIDMSALPPVQGERHGKLFSFLSSIKSGYAATFRSSRKNGRNFFRVCMAMFAIVVVLMSSVFGKAFGSLAEAKRANNANVFYVYTPDADISSRLNAAVGEEDSGIDAVRLMGHYPYGDSTISFRVGSFETFEAYDAWNRLIAHAVYLDLSLAEGKRLVVGKNENIKEDELVITTRVAETLLEGSALGYLKEEGDLIGLVCNSFTIQGQNPRIVGIVESDESAVYMTELALARYACGSLPRSFVRLASDYGITLSPGEAVLATRGVVDRDVLPSVGEVIKLCGRDITVSAVREAQEGYWDYLVANGLDRMHEDEFYRNRLLEDNPSLKEDSIDFALAMDQAREKYLYDYYEYYYAYVDGYYRDLYFFEPDMIELWLYFEKNVEVARYTMLPEDYYKAVVYRERFGSYPSVSELNSQYDLPLAYEAVKEYITLYEDEFYANSYGGTLTGAVYLVHDTDYIAFSKMMGETHPSAYLSNYGVDYVPYGMEKLTSADVEISIDTDYIKESNYTVIHSIDPERTEAWLLENFSSLKDPTDFWRAIVTPDVLFASVIDDEMVGIVSSIIVMAVFLVLMSLCMYFIMRSSLMNRIREIGIYRAIGVSKRNLVFRFFVEALVTASLTVLVGYLIISGFIGACFGISSLASEMFYYPIWLALADLLLLYAISAFFGILPILGLLRKTPSEILAKYDI